VPQTQEFGGSVETEVFWTTQGGDRDLTSGDLNHWSHWHPLMADRWEHQETGTPEDRNTRRWERQEVEAPGDKSTRRREHQEVGAPGWEHWEMGASGVTQEKGWPRSGNGPSATIFPRVSGLFG
ncbi:hypothetical protein LEMLEM_LOCUS5668, partial [Lemmus lemmus]